MNPRDKLIFSLAGAIFGISLLALGVSTIKPLTATSGNTTPEAGRAFTLPEFSEFTVNNTPERYAALYQRPLFAPDRKAVTPPPAPDKRETATKPAPLPLTLVGVIIGNGKKLAVVKRAGESEVVSLSQGETIDGWAVVDVQHDAVVLQAEGLQRRLQLPEKE